MVSSIMIKMQKIFLQNSDTINKVSSNKTVGNVLMPSYLEDEHRCSKQGFILSHPFHYTLHSDSLILEFKCELRFR